VRILSYKLLVFAAMMFVAAVAYTRHPQATTPVSHIVVSLPNQNGNQVSLDLEVNNNELVGVTEVGSDGARTRLLPKNDPASSGSKGRRQKAVGRKAEKQTAVSNEQQSTANSNQPKEKARQGGLNLVTFSWRTTGPGWPSSSPED